MRHYSYAMADSRDKAFQFTADVGWSASYKFEVIYFNLWKVWTQESFQKVEFDRPGELSPE